MRKWLTALLFIGEWLFFLWLLLMIILLNLVYLFNLLYTDMPWEEAILLTPSSFGIWFFLCGIGLCIFFLQIVQVGKASYRWSMTIVWACLLGWTAINSLFWFIYSHGWTLSGNERIVLFFMFIVSLILTILAIFLLRGQRNINKTVK